MNIIEINVKGKSAISDANYFLVLNDAFSRSLTSRNRSIFAIEEIKGQNDMH